MNYTPVNENMTIGELMKSGVYGEFANYIFTDMTPDHYYNKLSAYGYEKVGFEATLHRMEELAATGKSYVHPLYNEEERMSEWDKAKSCFLHFPGPNPNKPYVVIIPGGAFNRQWGLIEGMSIATRFNELGYTAFVLYYRTKQEPVIQKSIEDMYACIRQIEEHADDFQVQKSHYIIGGFSAGATLAGEIGSTNFGWQTAGVPKPEMIFLGYTAIQVSEFYKTYCQYPKGHPAHNGSAEFLRRIGGPEFDAESIAAYELSDFMDTDYPPTFLTANEDDGTVSFSNTLHFIKTAEKLGIPYRTKLGNVGGHSFGLGNGLEVEGWMEEAIEFWRCVTE